MSEFLGVLHYESYLFDFCGGGLVFILMVVFGSMIGSMLRVATLPLQMNPFMIVKIKLGKEFFSTILTFKSPNTVVDLHVLRKVALLSKTYFTMGTFVWSLISMNH